MKKEDQLMLMMDLKEAIGLEILTIFYPFSFINNYVEVMWVKNLEKENC